MLQKEFYMKLEMAREKQDELYHHGILGQKWGVRRFQEKDGSYTQAGRERYGYGPARGEKVGIMIPVTPGVAAGLLAVAAGINAAGFTYDAIHNAKVSHDIKKWEAHRATEKTDPETGLKLKDNPNATIKEDMKMVNREYGYGIFARETWDYTVKKAKGHTENCMLCTTALDLKRRGYDVKAGTSDDGYYASDLKKWYKEEKDATTGKFKDIVNQLKSEPEGSHGNIMVFWAMGGGHSMFYQIEDGEPIIYDAQSNKTYDINHIASHVNTSMSGHCFLRTDDLTPNYEYLKENKIIG